MKLCSPRCYFLLSRVRRAKTAYVRMGAREMKEKFEEEKSVISGQFFFSRSYGHPSFLSHMRIQGEQVTMLVALPTLHPHSSQSQLAKDCSFRHSPSCHVVLRQRFLLCHASRNSFCCGPDEKITDHRGEGEVIVKSLIFWRAKLRSFFFFKKKKGKGRKMRIK